MDEYRTLGAESRFELDPEKGSRFLATLAPVTTADEAGAFVARIAAKHAGASHHCFAYRLGPGGEEFRSSDAGEPAGSAGRPILAQLEGHDVTNACCVVTRWFGGTKLGVGGLVRAYGAAAGKALDRAKIVTVVVTRRLEVALPYACSGAVDALLAARRLKPVGSEYGEDVRLVLEVPVRDLEAFRSALADATAGRAELSP